jgi:serine/threonine protein kinase
VYKAKRLHGIGLHVAPFVAIKVVYRNKLSKEDEELIRKENSILKLLNDPIMHNNVIKFFDFYEDTSAFFMVLELIEGGELFDRLVKKIHYSEKEARDLVLVLLSAVKHCHDRDVVHR